jgi:hypothetical protein
VNAQEQKFNDLETDVREQLEAGAKRMDAMQTELTANTEATQRVEANTSEMLAFFNTMKGAFKTLEMIGALAKPLGYILMAVGSIAGLWFTFKNGTPPPKP